MTSRPETKVLTGTPQRHSELAIVGCYPDSSSIFVRHVGLLAAEAELSGSVEVPILHMGPPIVAGEESASAPNAMRTVRVHLVGDMALTVAERNAMKNWCAKIDKQKRPRARFQQYVVDPPVKWERSEKGRRLFQRFSCAGFVLECYSEAGIDLLQLDGDLPFVDEELLRRAYADLFQIEAAPPAVQARFGFKGRADLGLHGPGPWKIVLAGYLFHACVRASEKVPRPQPYVPASVGDANYPAGR